MQRKFRSIGIGLMLSSFHATAEKIHIKDNERIPSDNFVLDFENFTKGGGYGGYAKEEKNPFCNLEAAALGVQKAAQIDPENPRLLKIDVSAKSPAKPSFCSIAADLYFLKQIETVQRTGGKEFDIIRDAELNKALVTFGKEGDSQEKIAKDIIAGVYDGRGIFGHANANGPGIAVLFKKLDLGTNFALGQKPLRKGDYLKFIRNHEIGKHPEFGYENGHFVVVDHEGVNEEGKPGVFYWSSNTSTGGYGIKFEPYSDMKVGIVSRLERPENLVRWKTLPEEGPGSKDDPFLIKIQKNPGTLEEVEEATGIQFGEDFKKNYYAGQKAERAKKAADKAAREAAKKK